MTPPPPPAQPPRTPIPRVPSSSVATRPVPPPPPPIAPLDPGIPWGPIRIKWHGRYLRPEAASLIFGVGLLTILLTSFGCWRLFQLLSRPALIPQPAPIVNRFPPPLPRKSPRRAHIKPVPSKEQTDTPDNFPAATPASPSVKPSTDVQSGPRTSAAPIPPPVVIVFRVTPASIDRLASAILRWAVAGQVTAVTITPGPAGLSPSGELEVHPDRTTPYTLSATGPGGTVSESMTLRVQSAEAGTNQSERLRPYASTKAKHERVPAGMTNKGLMALSAAAFLCGG